MTPKFITPCFCRIEDADKRKEICEKLDQIGYHNFKAINNEFGDTIFTDLFFADASYTNEPSYVVWKNHMVVSQLRNTHIDCGTNINLFLALAGMRSDTDKGQWFVTKEPISIGTNVLLTGSMFCLGEDKFDDSIKARRATAQEITEHYNKDTK